MQARGTLLSTSASTSAVSLCLALAGAGAGCSTRTESASHVGSEDAGRASSGGGGAAFDAGASNGVHATPEGGAGTGGTSDAGLPCTGSGGPGTFTCTGSLSVPRDVPAGAVLPDGTVLVAGGWNRTDGVLTTAEIYDPAKGTFAPTGAMSGGHLWGGWGRALPVLANGKVLVAGGLDIAGQVSSGAELYDPTARTFSTTGAMPFGAISMDPVVLPDGSVLFIGGWDAVAAETLSELPGWSYVGSGVAAVQRYDPAAGAFQITGSLAEDRLFGCNVSLPGGNVLAIAGAQGSSTVEHNVEEYDATGGIWTTVASFTGAPFCSSAFALPNGELLLTGTGGLLGATLAVPGVVLFDPVTSTVRSTTNTIAGYSPSFVQLANGDVLAFGGTLNGAPTATAQLYEAATNAWRPVGNLNRPRGGAAGAFVLSTGDVLIVGGTDASGAPLGSAEVYHL